MQKWLPLTRAPHTHKRTTWCHKHAVKPHDRRSHTQAHLREHKGHACKYKRHGKAAAPPARQQLLHAKKSKGIIIALSHTHTPHTHRHTYGLWHTLTIINWEMFIMKWRDQSPGTMPSAKHFISPFSSHLSYRVCYSWGRGMQKRQTSNKPTSSAPIPCAKYTLTRDKHGQHAQPEPEPESDHRAPPLFALSWHRPS